MTVCDSRSIVVVVGYFIVCVCVCAVFVILFSSSSLVLFGDILGWDFLVRSASTEIMAQHTHFRINFNSGRMLFSDFLNIFIEQKKQVTLLLNCHVFFFLFFFLCPDRFKNKEICQIEWLIVVRLFSRKKMILFGCSTVFL